MAQGSSRAAEFRAGAKRGGGVLTTSRDASLRNGAEALELAERAVELSKGAQARIIATLAASYAEAGEFPKAVAAARRAQEQNPVGEQPTDGAGLNQMIVLYESKTAFRDGR
jgi:hypothetical protein